MKRHCEMEFVNAPPIGSMIPAPVEDELYFITTSIGYEKFVSFRSSTNGYCPNGAISLEEWFLIKPDQWRDNGSLHLYVIRGSFISLSSFKEKPLSRS